jgi:hypothetical protein
MPSNNGIRDITFYIQGQNLFLISKYRGIDPEIPGFGNMPMLRAVNIGLSVKL